MRSVNFELQISEKKCALYTGKYGKVDAEPQIKKPEIMLAFVVQVRLDADLDSYLCPNAKHMFPIFIFFLGGGGEEGYSCHVRQEQN